jgi:cardiolipin synthase
MFQRQVACRALKFAVSAIFLLATTSCTALPNTDVLIERHTGQATRFEDARGALSKQKSAAILAELERKSGNIDILEKQIVLEQAIVGSPLILGNKVTLLQDGAATYAAMTDAIRGAGDHINLESYIIEDDEIGQHFSNLLLERQAAGVQVNVIYDSFGSINTPQAFFARLVQGGINVLEFNPINPLAVKVPWAFNHRDHRKLLIVDGRTAFIGGINISSVYSSYGSAVQRPGKPARNIAAWRDTDIRIEGPVVGELQKLFMETWQKQRGKPLAGKDYFPALTAQGKDIVRAIGSTPDDPYSLIYLTLISAIGNAERQIHLTQSYFIPDPQLLKSLAEAAGRGVDVKLILPSHSDSDTTFHAGRSHYAFLLRAGVKVYQRRDALLHAKTVVIDGVWSCVGSSNLDWRSFLDNDEINAVVLGREFARQMDSMFAADLADSDVIDLQSWERRSLMLRFKEWLARLVQRLL